MKQDATESNATQIRDGAYARKVEGEQVVSQDLRCGSEACLSQLAQEVSPARTESTSKQMQQRRRRKKDERDGKSKRRSEDLQLLQKRAHVCRVVVNQERRATSHEEPATSGQPRATRNNDWIPVPSQKSEKAWTALHPTVVRSCSCQVRCEATELGSSSRPASTSASRDSCSRTVPPDGRTLD
ncbi:MAG: hypothetical protein M1837_005166 [Sclerophora amabilis]|nr:MAG: hypothetical protein M1837_005166 [Sclerophora amabilis]